MVCFALSNNVSKIIIKKKTIDETTHKICNFCMAVYALKTIFVWITMTCFAYLQISCWFFEQKTTTNLILTCKF